MRKKYGLKQIHGINIQNALYLNRCFVASLKTLSRYQGNEVELKKAMRKKFPVDNLPSVESLQNWCQQAHLLEILEEDRCL